MYVNKTFIISFLLFVIIITIIESSNCNKKEGMENTHGIVSGKIVGTIRHAMSPAILSTKRNVRTIITNAFSNPDVKYYTNRLQQIFR